MGIYNRSALIELFDAEQTGKIVVVVGSLCILVQCLILLRVPPATGYETTVFQTYPLTYQTSFIVTLVAVLALFLVAAASRTDHWRHGLLLLAMNYGLFFALPLFRNYHLYGRGAADKLVHLADVSAIVRTGTFVDLFYPLEHVFLAELVVLSGVSRESVSYLFPYVLTMIYIVSVGLCVRYLLSKRSGLAVGLFVATPLLFMYFHLSISPSVMSFLLVPLFVLLLERFRRSKTYRSSAILTLFAIAFIPFHTITSLLVIVLTFTTVVFVRLYRKFSSRGVQGIPLYFPVVLGVVWLAWNSSFPGPRGFARTAFTTLLTGGRSVAAAEASRAASIPFTPLQLVSRFVELYGAIFVYLIAAGIISLFVLVRSYRDEVDYVAALLSYQFGVGALVAVTFLSVYLIASNPIRISRYMVIMAVLLVATYLSRRFATPADPRRVAVAILAVGIVAAAVLGAGATYQPNYQMTETEYTGAKFTLHHHDPALPVRSFDMFDNMDVYVLGLSRDAERSDTFRSDEPGYGLPPALGYDENRTASETFGSSYVVTKQYDIQFYTAPRFTEAQRDALFQYGPSHVRRLSRDPTAQKVYTNGGLKTWRVTNQSATTEDPSP